MIYLKTNYTDFIGQKLNENITPVVKIKTTPIDYAKINCQKEKMSALQRQLSIEKDPKVRKRLQTEIKICELKIMVLQIR